MLGIYGLIHQNKYNIYTMVNEKYDIRDSMSIKVGKGFGDSFDPIFNMRLELFDSDGNIKDIRDVHNTVTTAGRAGIMDQVLATPTLAKAGWMELGTGTGGSTTLNAYIASSRVALTTKTRSGSIITMVGDWAAGVGTGAITEAGIFDVATQNTVNMWCYASFTVINKAAGDTLKITWTLTGS
jgi:hypothetical protein